MSRNVVDELALDVANAAELIVDEIAEGVTAGMQYVLMTGFSARSLGA
jgi:hypothetical protein